MNYTEKQINEWIDWKFFNYLKDKITSYEDSGDIISINIDAIIEKYPDEGYQIYKYKTGNPEKYTNSHLYTILINKYIHTQYAIHFDLNIPFEQLYESIKHKCILVAKMPGMIIVRPKN